MRESHNLFMNCPYEETEIKSIGNFNRNIDANTAPVNTTSGNTPQSWINAYGTSKDIFKAYIPWYLYKPPYGYPRDVNPLELRQFAKNPYIFTVVKTIQEEIANSSWDVKLKEEYQEEFQEDLDSKKQILHFFDRPNGNYKETFRTIIKSWVKDICEIGNSIGVKVFNRDGNFSQLLARDSSTFLLNTDQFGMLDKRAEFVRSPESEALTANLPTNFVEEYAKVKTAQGLEELNKKYRTDLTKENTYDAMYSENAAYFQYGWTAGARPVPFGTREIIWIEMNPRSNNIYPESPISVLWNTILTLQYGLEYNLDFYLNNNLPNGLLYFEGVNQTQAETMRSQMARIFMEKDEYGNKKKQHFNVPITGNKPEFIQMQMTSKEMEVIEQQKWFSKLVWMAFGLNENELGFIENVNKANGQTQEKAIIRKIIKPYIQAIEDAINNQLMPEFGHPEYEFKFDNYSIDDEKKLMDLYEQKIRIGIMSPEMVAKEVGIDTAELFKFKEEKQSNEENFNIEEDFTFEEKSLSEGIKMEKEHKETYMWLEKYIKEVGEVPTETEFYKKIAEDHISEFPNYYDALKKMEKELNDN